MAHGTRGILIAVVGLSLGLITLPGFAAQGPASRQVASAERAVKDAGATVTREVTDSWLTFHTKLALLADERVTSGDIHVTTRRGVIALRGKVDSEAEQQAAGEIARTIEGARDVNNQLTVVSGETRRTIDREDREIAQDVKQEFKQDARLKRVRIHVRADEGIVTLTGKAPSLATSVRASEAARRVPGVRAVHNELTL
jgi:hyperosmotically inducible protein